MPINMGAADSQTPPHPGPSVIQLAPKPDAVPLIEAFDLPIFLTTTITPRRYVLNPWLREKGLAMVHAKTGIGKTWFGLSCAYAIATGSTFLKWQAPTPLRVCYLDGEMAAEDVQDRLRTICANKLPDPDYFKIAAPTRARDNGVPCAP